MPVVKRFGSFVIRIYFNDHNPPHFHIVTPDAEAQIAIEHLTVIQGEVPGRVLRRALDWAAQNQDALWSAWNEGT